MRSSDELMRRALTTMRRSLRRGLASEDGDGVLIELNNGVINLVVAGDDGLGERHIGLVEGFHSVADGGRHKLGDGDELVLDFEQFLLE
jgi:hypothetical protein